VLTAGALGVFAVMGTGVGRYPLLLQGLIVILLIGTSSMLAVLTPYASEVYPTRIRARGTGFGGMCARAGGFIGVGVVLAGIAPPSLAGSALLGAVPTALAVIAIARFGVETRRRRLEEITAAEVRVAPAAAATS
jgi:putative MFS transporter